MITKYGWIGTAVVRFMEIISVDFGATGKNTVAPFWNGAQEAQPVIETPTEAEAFEFRRSLAENAVFSEMISTLIMFCTLLQDIAFQGEADSETNAKANAVLKCFPRLRIAGT